MRLILFSHVAYMVDLSLNSLRFQPLRFAEHLRACDVDPSEEILPDHPIWPFLDHLCQITYYLPAFDSNPDFHQIRHVWLLISATLDWVQRHQEVGSAYYPPKIHPANTIHLSSSWSPRTCTATCNINSAL